MSRIGNKIIEIPEGVTVTINGSVITCKGPKGEATCTLNNGISAHMEDKNIRVVRENDTKQVKQNHGTSRANLHNTIVGVSQGYSKILQMEGIGYKATMQGEDVVLNAGYSHQVTIKPNTGVKISVAMVNNKPEITVSGIDKQAVGQTAARIREVRPPEPYLGKGIRYKGEHITLKEGKRAAGGKK